MQQLLVHYSDIVYVTCDGSLVPEVASLDRTYHTHHFIFSFTF